MAVINNIVSFWKRVKLKSSDMFTLFKVGIGIKVPTHKLHVKDSSDPIKIEGLQNDTTDPDKYLTIDSSNIVKYRTGSEVYSDIGAATAQSITGATDTDVTITSDKEVIIKIDADDDDATGTSKLKVTNNADTEVFSVNESGAVSVTGALGLNNRITNTGTNDDLTIESDGNLTFIIDKDDDETSQSFSFLNYTTEVANIDESGNLQVDGGITVGSTSIVNNSGILQSTPVNNITSLTGIFTGSANQLVTDDGDGTVTSEANLQFSSETLKIGADDNGIASIYRTVHSDDSGGRLEIRSGDATGTNKSGGDLMLEGGKGTGSGTGGSIQFYSHAAGSSGDTAGTLTVVGEIDSSGNLQIDGDLTVSGNDIKDDDGTTCITFDSSGNTSVGGTLSCADLDITGTSNALTVNPQTGNVAINCISTDADCMVRVQDNSTTGTNVIGFVATGDDSIIRNDEGNFKVKMANNATETLTLDQSGNLTVPGVVTSKQYQVFPSNFIDDLNTSEVFIPIHGTTFEQATVYQDDVALLAPCDGRVVSVDISVLSVTGAADLTIKVYTRGPNNSGTSLANWTEEESEVLPIEASDDNHVLHFAFSNAKHFESTEKFAISIQASSDISSNTYFYTTTVVEWDYSTLLGTSAEFDAAP